MTPGGGVGKDRDQFAEKTIVIFIIEPRSAFRVRLSSKIQVVNRILVGSKYLQSTLIQGVHLPEHARGVAIQGSISG